MACFLVPAAEAAVITAVKKASEKKTQEGGVTKHPFLSKIGILSNMLWGGSALLAFEHVWHGEVVPWFPFLTAASDPADAAEMLHEMATSGVAMAGLVSAVWVGVVLFLNAAEKRPKKDNISKEATAV